MSILIVTLGTSASIPTNSRSLPCILVKRNGEKLLFDCGEGCQRQMIKANVGFGGRMNIFISHMHGDHVLGLAGLLQTMSLMRRVNPLQIFGPKGILDFINAIRETVKFTLTFPLQVKEVSEGLVYEGQGFQVYSTWVNHSVPTLAYSLVERERPGVFHPEKANQLGVPKGPLWKKLQEGVAVTLNDGRVIRPEQVLGPPRRGFKVTYSSDTAPCSSLINLARDADVLIHEATLSDSLMDKAIAEKHSTPSLAAQVAKEANVKLLILTHISPRYKRADLLIRRARNIFPNIVVAKDFDKFTLRRTI